MANVIQELIIKLGYGKVDSAPLDQATDKAAASADKVDKRWQDTAKNAGKAFAGLGAIIAGAGGSLLAFTDHMTSGLDAIAKGARAAGLASDEYQRLTFAAERGGASVTDLRTSFKFLDQQMLAARQGGGSEFANALDVIGISIEDLAGRSGEDRLGVLSDALNKVADDSLRMGLQQRVLGESSGQLSSLIAGGSAGLSEMSDEAERLGIVMGTDALDAAESYQDQMLDTKRALESTAKSVSVSLLPAMTHWLTTARESIVVNRELIESTATDAVGSLAMAVELALPVVTNLFESLADGVGVISDIDEGLGKATPALVGLTAAVAAAAGPWAALAAALGLVAANLDKIIEGVQDSSFGEFLGVGFGAQRKQANRQRATRIRSTPARFAEGAFLDAEDIGKKIKELESQRGDVVEALRNPQKALRRKGMVTSLQSLRSRKLADARVDLFDLTDDQLQEIADASQSVAAKSAASEALRSRRDAAAVLQDITSEITQSEQAKKLAEQEERKKAGARKAGADARRLADAATKARGAFGEQLGFLAEREGLGNLAIEQAIQAAAQSLLQGSTEGVARKAALGRLGGLAGVDLTPKYNQDPLLRDLLGENVPDVKMSTLALGAAPQVLNSTINNYFEFDNDFAINGGDGSSVARQIASTLRETFEGSVEKSTKLNKIRFVR